MLSDGFADELAEIIKSCPVSRQTMLFSATMTDSVDELVKMSLNKPVRIFVDPKRSTARGLVQEFVRVKAGKEEERSALLVALCKRTFKTNVIVFLRSKKLAHQMRIMFTLLGMKCEELHGDLSQEQVRYHLSGLFAYMILMTYTLFLSVSKLFRCSGTVLSIFCWLLTWHLAVWILRVSKRSSITTCQDN